MKFPLTIMARDGIFLQDDISQFDCTTQDGDIGILPNHAPLVATLKEGPVRIFKGLNIKTLHLPEGLLKVDKNGCTIILMVEKGTLTEAA